MTSSIWLNNLASYTVQVGVLVGAGALVARFFKLRTSAATLIYWHGLLAGCLILPLCQPWQTTRHSSRITAVRTIPATAHELPALKNPASSPQSTPWPDQRAVLIFLVSGVALRCLWLAIGTVGLRRFRQTASRISPALPELAKLARIEQMLGIHAEFYLSDRTVGPITFGLRRPVIILPRGILGMAPSTQEAIACHELLHVRRRDWVYEIAEECVRALLWFHPAIWWLIGRIRLSREQVVDRAVIELTRSREQYIEALLTVALTKSRPQLLPAPLFLRKRLLKKRVAEVLKETSMSRFRSIVCLASSCCLVVLAAAATIQMFPLEGRAHDANAPVQVAKGGEYLLHDTPIEYPQRALERKIEGDVLLEVTVNDQGLVSDARVLSGPEELRRVALESALQWHYSPAMPRPATTQALIRFRLPALVEGLGGRFYEFKNEKALFEVSEEAHLKARHLEWRMPEIQVKPKNPESPEAEKENLERQLVELKSYRLKPVDGVYSKQIVLSENPSIKEYHAKLLPDTAIVVFEGIDVEVHTDNERSLFREPVTLTKIRSERVSEAAMNLLSPRLGVRVGDTISEETAKEIEKLVQSIDEHFRVSFHSDDKGGVELVIVGP